MPLSLLFLTPRLVLSSHQHRTLVCLFLIWEPTLCSQWNSKSHYCSPRVLQAAGCIQQPKSLFLRHLAIPGFPQSDHTVSKLSADADSLWNTAKQASRPQAILKTQPPICLDYRASNRPQHLHLVFGLSDGSNCCQKNFLNALSFFSSKLHWIVL